MSCSTFMASRHGTVVKSAPIHKGYPSYKVLEWSSVMLGILCEGREASSGCYSRLRGSRGDARAHAAGADAGGRAACGGAHRAPAADCAGDPDPGQGHAHRGPATPARALRMRRGGPATELVPQR